MEAGELQRQRILVNARALIAKFSRFRFVFTLSSFAYCAVHWLIVHSFSIYVFSGALIFGLAAATAVAWLSDWFSSPST